MTFKFVTCKISYAVSNYLRFIIRLTSFFFSEAYYGYKKEDIVKHSDDWLTRDACPHDALFFFHCKAQFKCMIYIISFFHPYCLLDSDNGGQTEEADAFDEGEVLLCFE